MSNGKKILIVEDDNLTMNILEFILKKEGYALTIARDGSEAIEKIPEVNPDLVITDVMLPFKSGLEITNFVKENYTNTPVIILSALGEEENTVTNGFKLGADDFIAKPFNPKELILRVKRLIEK
ncbi:response regulator [Flavobacterium supellecticarium]|uniref:Response regulator n=1 Tax=Flavobacterium supellecticarium TaxID=2565924 RepID=A0A4V3W8K0_9FLAO|nr:response regulator [Flavobacterium supellecticarium]THF51480.1 response regulator [Flavobacterium supellecticarium]